MIDEALKQLSGLYSITGEDWSLRVHVSLTEPNCPTAIISPDGWDISRYRCDGNSIEDAIVGAADMVYREVILREQAATFECYTEGDDALYARWIKTRIAGNDAKLPVRNCGSPSGEF